MTEPAAAQSWTCDRCGVSVSQMDGTASSLPEGWALAAGEQFCLMCRRERAGEAALDSEAVEDTHEARARHRKAAVIEFEVNRVPEHSNGQIARACRSSAAAVAKSRKALGFAEPQPRQARSG